jgi:hypothetical protein
MRPTLEAKTTEHRDADMVDFVSFFKDLDPYNLRILTALRMNATFPYVLPNVWLPTHPVIDVMDAGLRDNFGLETSLRFIQVFKDWIKENTSKVVIIQIRDRRLGDWEDPEENVTVLSWLTKPMLLLQNNLFKIQDYYQADELSYAAATLPELQRITFQYMPASREAYATLSFHLTNFEQQDIKTALKDSLNRRNFDKVSELSKQSVNRLQ